MGGDAPQSATPENQSSIKIDGFDPGRGNLQAMRKKAEAGAP